MASTYPNYSKSFLRNHKEFPQHNAYVDVEWSGKGTKYYCVTIANKYAFRFNTKKSLVQIEDVSTGTWNVLTKKADRDWWLSRSGSREVYEKHVLPCLYMFIESRRK